MDKIFFKGQLMQSMHFIMRMTLLHLNPTLQSQTLFNQLILNVQRSRQLEAEEAMLAGIDHTSNPDLKANLEEKVRTARGDQRVRAAGLYALFDGRAYDTLERQVPGLTKRLRAAVEAQRYLDEEFSRVQDLERDRTYSCLDWDDAERMVAQVAIGSVMDGDGEVDTARSRLTEVRQQADVANEVYADAAVRFEYFLDTHRRRELAIYQIVEPGLVREGYIEPRALLEEATTARVRGSSPPDDVRGSRSEQLDDQNPSNSMPQTMTQVNRADIEKQFTNARENLERAQETLENVRAEYKQMQAKIAQKVEAREWTSTQSEMDLFFYNMRKQRKHAVAEAEQKLDYAKHTAREFGVLPRQQTSGFRDWYTEDVEGDADSDVVRSVAMFDPEKVLSWRKGTNAAFPRDLEDATLPVPEAERGPVDDFDAQSVGFGGSLSVVAKGKERAKIAKYGGTQSTVERNVHSSTIMSA